MKLPGPGRLLPVPAAEPRPANEDDPRRRLADLPLRKPGLPLDAEVEPPFLRPERRTRPRKLRRGPVWDSVRLARWGACAVLVAFGVWLGYSRAMASERLKVSRVDVRGGRFLSEGEVRQLLEPAVGQNILSLDIEQLKARLRSSPWVADATVVRSLPDTLRVEIHERHPLALAELEGLHLMDAEGGFVDMHGPHTAFDLPIVRGLGDLPAEERRERTRAAGAVLSDLGDLATVVSEVHPQADGTVRLVLRGTSDVVVVGELPCRDKVAAFLGLRDQLAARVPSAEYWDLRFEDRIFAKPAPTPTPVPPPPAAAPSHPVPVIPAQPISPDGDVRVLPAASPEVPPVTAIPVALTVPLAGGR